MKNKKNIIWAVIAIVVAIVVVSLAVLSLNKKVVVAPVTSVASAIPFIQGNISSISAASISVKDKDGKVMTCGYNSQTLFDDISTGSTTPKVGDVITIGLDPKTSKAISAVIRRDMDFSSIKSDYVSPSNVTIGEVTSVSGTSITVKDSTGKEISLDLAGMNSVITYTVQDPSAISVGDDAYMKCNEQTDGSFYASVVTVYK